MKETPIIMSGNHPRLILDLLKTQTRRVIKPQPELSAFDFAPYLWKGTNYDHLMLESKCPYSQVGDRLWVKETWATENRYNNLKPSELPQTAKIWYLADCDYDPFQVGIIRPSIFMPRWASRILPVITEVRVERVQDITAGDCTKEGIPYEDGDYVSMKVFEKFHLLWDSLNAKRGYGWETNPWVWCLSFKVVGEI